MKTSDFNITEITGYAEIDLFECFSGKCKALDKLLSKVAGDKPMLIWKKPRRKQAVAIIKGKDIAHEVPTAIAVISYGDWLILPLSSFDNL